MLRTTLANLRVHKGRLLLSSVAIVAATAFLAGALLFTDAMRTALTNTYTQNLGRADVVVTALDGGPDGAREVLTAVRGVDGVAGAYARVRVSDRAVVHYPGDQLVAATLVSVPKDPLLGWPHLTAGRLPARPGEAVLDRATARRSGLSVGETVTVNLNGLDSASRTLRIVGVADPGEPPRYADMSFVGVTTRQAAQLAGVLGEADAAPTVLARGGQEVSAEQLAEGITRAVGSSSQVRTAVEHARAQVTGGGGAGVRTVLLGFAAVALFVAAIVIANTFSILLAQRTREMALLRCVGASRGQVFGSVLAESALLGLAGSVVGVVVGFGLTYAVGSGLQAAFADFPFSAVAPSIVAVLVPVVVGVVVTVTAAVLPARAATRIPPVAALRDHAVAATGRTGRVRLACAGVALVVGVVGLILGSLGAFGLSSQRTFAVVFAGGVLAFLGVLLATPVLVPPLVRLTGTVVGRVLGTPGRLATINTLRNPRRAAATTAALLVGVMLISLLSVGAATTRATVTAKLNEKFPADYLVRSEGGMPASVAESVRAVSGLADVTVTRGTTTRLQGQPGVYVGGYNPTTLDRVVDPSAFRAIIRLDPGEVVVTEDLAGRLGLGQGDTVRFRGLALTVTALLPAVGGQQQPGSVYLTHSDLARLLPEAPVVGVFARAAPGADLGRLTTAISRATAGHEVTVVGTAKTQATYTRTLDTVLLVATALLAVAMLIAVVGVANTLALSVIERTRESGLLRALGLTRGQLRATLAVEATLLAIVGALLGAIVGTVFGWAAITAVLGTTFDVVLAIPWLRLAGLTAIAVLAGLLASVLPARRAARASVVVALSDE